MVSNGNRRNAGPGMRDITRPNFSGGCRIAQPIYRSKLPHRQSKTTATMDKVRFDGFRIRSFASLLRSAVGVNSSFELGGQLYGQAAGARVPLDLAIHDSVTLPHQTASLPLNASGKLRIQPAILAHHAPVRRDVLLSSPAVFLGSFRYDPQKNSRYQWARHVGIMPVGQTTPNL